MVGSAGCRHRPLDAFETGEIAIEGQDRCSVLDRQSRQVRVGDQLRSFTEIAKQACEDGPVHSRSQATLPRDATLN